MVLVRQQDGLWSCIICYLADKEDSSTAGGQSIEPPALAKDRDGILVRENPSAGVIYQPRGEIWGNSKHKQNVVG